MTIETITDSFGGEHVIVYKSETEWTSYTKAVYDKMLAAQAEKSTPMISAIPITKDI
jgi:hypothetical protein